ncbi:MAG: hypothetical protein AAFQ87_28405, partial [Bacteroidota bacterium]
MTKDAVAADLSKLSIGFMEQTLPKIRGALQSEQGSETIAEDGVRPDKDVQVAIETDGEKRASANCLNDEEGGLSQAEGCLVSRGAVEDFDRLPISFDPRPAPPGPPPVQEQPFDVVAELSFSGGVSATVGPPAGLVSEQWTSVAGSLAYDARQDHDDARIVSTGAANLQFPVFLGPRTNRLFGFEHVSLPVADVADLSIIDGDIGYYYRRSPAFSGLHSFNL